jgi:hypothetical protein
MIGVTLTDVRAVAITLPRTSEHLIRDYTKFRIGSIVYASVAPDEVMMGCGFPKDEREAMIEAEPDKFVLPKPSDLRYHWINVRMAQLDDAELRELIVEAWRMCVPKKISALVK